MTNKEIIEGLFWIQDKRQNRVRFKLNDVQAKYDRGKSAKDIILKARKEGFSSYILADQYCDCLRRPTNAVVISHEKESAARLFGRVKYFHDNLLLKPVIKYDTRTMVSFPKVGSSYYVGTAGQRAFGRGDDLHRVHCSEVAFWKNPKEVIIGVKEAMTTPAAPITIESSPNGRGNWFYDEYNNAKEKKSIYKPHFYPWFMNNKEYTADWFTEKDLEGMPAHILEMIRAPEIKLTDEEKDLQGKYGLKAGQIKWRRYKIWDIADLFWQEFPEDDVSCFLQSGRPVFRIVNMVARPNLQKNRSYLGGLDGAEGIEGGDNHSFAVISTEERPMKVIFEITNNEPIDVFDRQVAKLMGEYKIKLAVEKNGVGKAHCEKLKDLGVQFKEWTTDNSTRPVMIVELEEAYRKDELQETYLEAKNELMDIFYDDKNRPSHRANRHDDRVFARAIAWQMRKEPEPNLRFL